MKILLTGATGFIGDHLCKRLLNEGHQIFALVRDQSSVSKVEKNITDFSEYHLGDSLPSSIVNFSPEVVIHLAWDGIPDYSLEKCIENLHFQSSFIRQISCLSSVEKVVISGTCLEYNQSQGPCAENITNEPTNYFSWAKESLRRMSELHFNEAGINLFWLRLFYVYGPGQREKSLIPTIISSFAKGETPEIKNPKAANDFIFIDDVTSAFLRSIESCASGGTYNVGSGYLTSINEVLTAVRDATLSPSRDGSECATQSQDNHKNGFWADTSKVNKDLDWYPQVTISEGIKLTYEKWHKAN